MPALRSVIAVSLAFACAFSCRVARAQTSDPWDDEWAPASSAWWQRRVHRVASECCEGGEFLGYDPRARLGVEARVGGAVESTDDARRSGGVAMSIGLRFLRRSDPFTFWQHFGVVAAGNDLGFELRAREAVDASGRTWTFEALFVDDVATATRVRFPSLAGIFVPGFGFTRTASGESRPRIVLAHAPVSLLLYRPIAITFEPWIAVEREPRWTTQLGAMLTLTLRVGSTGTRRETS